MKLGFLDELEGAMMDLGVRPMAQLEYIYTNARSTGNKQEELEVIM